MQVLRSALRNIDDYSTLTHSGANALWCGSPRSLFWPHEPVVSASRAARLLYKGAAALPPHHTPLVGRWVILRHSRIKSLRNCSQTGASVTGTTPLFQHGRFLMGQLCDRLTPF
jgi:hypothetical protein